MGLLQPLPIPVNVWEDISMDFITHLPPSNGKSVIWVVIDRLTKYAHFLALPSHFSAATIAPIFLSEIYKLHGMPKTIVSDRDRVFISHFWRELFRLMGTTLAYTSAYHPQSDGQTEVTNHILETYLRCFVGDSPHLWAKFLHLAEYWYNSSYQSAIKMSPFEALYGRSPPTIRSYVTGSTTVAALDESLICRRHMLHLLRENLALAQMRMKSHADARRQDRSFEVGDWVWLRLQPYRQHSVARRGAQKLAKRYFGPFPITKVIGKVAYELKLPPQARIHPVFHISKLKPFYGTPPSQIPLLDDSVFSTRVLVSPNRILDTRMVQCRTGSKKQFLIQWRGLPAMESTWEDADSLLSDYPNLEDKVEVEEGGNDTLVTDPGSLGSNSDAGPSRLRPKRSTNRPIWMKDYV